MKKSEENITGNKNAKKTEENKIDNKNVKKEKNDEIKNARRGVFYLSQNISRVRQILDFSCMELNAPPALTNHYKTVVQ